MNKTAVLYIKENDYYLYDGNELKKSFAKEAKNYYCGTFISSLSLYMYSSKMSSNISDEQREINMDIAMHEEGGADANEIYTTALLTHPLVGDNDTLVDLFALSQKNSKSLYSGIIKDTKTIDFIIPSFFAYEVWYKNREKHNGTELIIYLGDEEAYGVIYQNGKYIAHRAIEHLSRLAAESGVDLATLKAMLKTKGLKEEAYEPQELAIFTSIQELMAKSIERIAHTFNHKRGLFGLDDINSVVLDFEASSIGGLEDIFSAFGMYDIQVKPLSFGTKIDPVKTHDILNAKYLYDVVVNKSECINVSPFEREAPFVKQPSAIFLLMVFLSVLLSGIYPYILNAKLSILENEGKNLKENINKSKKLSSNIDKKIKTLTKELKTFEEKNMKLKEKKEFFQQSLDALPLAKVSSLKRQKMVDDTLINLKKNGLKVKSIEQNSSKSISLHVLTFSSKRDDIASFMKDMASLGYQKIKTQKIYKTNKYQESVVEVIR